MNVSPVMCATVGNSVMIAKEDNVKSMISKVTKGKLSTPVDTICGEIFIVRLSACLSNIRALSGVFPVENGEGKGRY